MRKTIIFGTLAALFGFAALAQASDRSRAEAGESTQVVTRVAANDSHGDRHERYRSCGRHDVSGDKRRETREDDHEDEAAEHRDRL